MWLITQSKATDVLSYTHHNTIQKALVNAQTWAWKNPFHWELGSKFDNDMRFQKPKSNLSNEITLQKETDCDFQLKLPVNYISNHKHLIKDILITYLQIILIMTNIKVWLHITTFHSFLRFVWKIYKKWHVSRYLIF